MSRSKYTFESSIPHMRGRKGNLKGKRLSAKRARRMALNTSRIEMKNIFKSVELDVDPPYNKNGR